MLTFGFGTPIDLLTWIAIICLGLKLAATIILLSVGKERRDESGWGSSLWWVTKITPVIAVPCLIAIVMVERLTDQLWIFLALMTFVVVAVPMKIRQRRRRMAMKTPDRDPAASPR